MNKCIAYFFGLMLLTCSLNAQQQPAQKLQQIKSILNSVDLTKLDPTLQQQVDQQLNTLLEESQKIVIILNPPFVPAHWQLSGYRQGKWTALMRGKIEMALRYRPAFSPIKLGYWYGEHITVAQFAEFCRKNNYRVGDLVGNPRTSGPVRQVSPRGKQLFVEWLIARKLSPQEWQKINSAQKQDQFFVLVLPEMRKNVFYQIDLGSLPIDVKPWKNPDEENQALASAITYWQKITGTTKDDRQKIAIWLESLQKHRQNLAAASKSFEQIDAWRREKLEKPATLDQEMSNLTRAVMLCDNYLNDVQVGKIAAHYRKSIGDWRQQWQNKKSKLEHLAQFTEKIKQARHKMRQKDIALKSEQLQAMLKQMLVLANDYQQLVVSNSLQDYADQDIYRWQQEIERQLSSQILLNIVNQLRKGYQNWKVQKNLAGIAKEMETIENFRRLYERQRGKLEKHPQKDRYLRDIQEWLDTTSKRRQAIAGEKELFDRLGEAYRVCVKSDKVVPQVRLVRLQQAIALIEDYQAKTQQDSISGYHRQSVGKYGKELQKQQQLLQKEIETFNQISKIYQQYLKTSFASLAKERESLGQIDQSIQEYEKLRQYQQITVFNQAKVKEYNQKIAARKALLDEEENVFTRMRIQFQKWQDNTSWNAAKDEVYELNKVEEYANEYRDKLRNTQISRYYQDRVRQWQQKIAKRSQHIDEEKGIFEPIRQLQLQHIKMKYDNLTAENASLTKIIDLASTYLEKYRQERISGYYHTQVKKWYDENLAQKQRVVAEEKVYDNLARAFQAWIGQKAWVDADSEMKAIKQAMHLGDDYQKQALQFNISNYHNKSVFGYIAKLKNRQKVIADEKQLLSRLHQAFQQINSQNYRQMELYRHDVETTLALCQEYNKKTQSGQLAGYYRKQVDSWLTVLGDKANNIKQVASLYDELKSTYNKWDTTTRWTDANAEEQAIINMLRLAGEYQAKLASLQMPPYHQAEIKKWRHKISKTQNLLQAEQRVYGKIKLRIDWLEKTNFKTMVEEQKALNTLMAQCEDYRQEIKKRTITRHYEKNVRSNLRRLKDRQRKLEKEDSLFTTVNSSYDIWKKYAPWSNKKAEKRAIKKIMDSIQEYKEHLQMKRISTYHSGAVERIEQEVRKRLAALRK